MRFVIHVLSDSRIEVSFASSKEEFKLGVLNFEDGDADLRNDVLRLFTIAMIGNPLVEVVE